MSHDQFLANNDHSSPCRLQNHPALWQLDPSLWFDLLKSWYWRVLVSREAKATKGQMRRLPGLVPGRGEVEPGTELSFYPGLWKEHGGGGVDVTLTTRIIVEDGPAKGLRKHTERKGDKCRSADHTCTSEWGLWRSPYTWWACCAQQHVWKQSVQLCVQLLLSESGDGTATLRWWPLFLTCLSGVRCSAAVVMADLGEKSTQWLIEHRNCHFAVPTEFILHLGSGILQIILL